MGSFLKYFIEKSKFWRKTPKTTESDNYPFKLNLPDFELLPTFTPSHSLRSRYSDASLGSIKLHSRYYDTALIQPNELPTGVLFYADPITGNLEYKTANHLSFTYYELEKDMTKEMLPKCYDYNEFYENKYALLSNYNTYDDYVRGYKTHIYYTLCLTVMKSVVCTDEIKSLQKIKVIENDVSFIG